MAAPGGIRDKILRVSMPFEKGKISARKSRAAGTQKGMDSGDAIDPWSVVLKVKSWARQLKEGRVRSCAEITRKEGITPARVSQLWRLSEITKDQVERDISACKRKEISLRGLIRIIRNPKAKLVDS